MGQSVSLSLCLQALLRWVTDPAVDAGAALARAQPPLSEDERADVLALRGLLVSWRGSAGTYHDVAAVLQRWAPRGQLALGPMFPGCCLSCCPAATALSPLRARPAACWSTA